MNFSIKRISAILVVVSVLCLQGFAAGEREAGENSTQTGITVDATVPGQYPLEMEDDKGHTVRLERKPQRIISLTVFTDDILLDLVDHSR